MKDKSTFIRIGIAIYIIVFGIDRFIYHIPNAVYIPASILGIILIMIGFFRDKNWGRKQEKSEKE